MSAGGDPDRVGVNAVGADPIGGDPVGVDPTGGGPVRPAHEIEPSNQTASASPRAVWWAFSACLIVVFMQMVDTTIVNIALPDLTTDLRASSSDQVLVLTVYTLAFACTLMTASRLGERWGRRRMFLGAVIAFTLASVLCGTSTGATELIVLRGVQGVSAACAASQTIAIVSAMFPRTRHGLVFGIYGATAGVAAILGPVAGGTLITADALGLGWRTIFLVNLPLGVVALAIAARHLPSTRSGHAESLDVVGVVVSAVGLFALIYPLSVGRERGWPAWLLAMLVAAVLVLTVFVVYELRLLRRGGSPLLRLDLFRHRAFAVGALLSVTFYGMLTAFFFAMSVAAQFGLGYSALRTGLITVPFALGAAVGSVASPVLVGRIGSRTLAVGLVMFGAAMGLTAALMDPSSGVLDLPPLIPGLVVGGVGVGLFVAPLQATIVSGTSETTVGSASGSIPTIQQIGASMGLAVIGVVFFAQVGASAPSAVSVASESLGSNLRSTAVPEFAQSFVVDEFSRCARLQLESARPEVRPPGCDAQTSSSGPRADIVRAAAPAVRVAARAAAARSFLHAFATVLWSVAAVAVVLAAICLVLRRTPTPAAPASRTPTTTGTAARSAGETAVLRKP